jgi:hypothetical protein
MPGLSLYSISLKCGRCQNAIKNRISEEKFIGEHNVADEETNQLQLSSLTNIIAVTGATIEIM